MEADLEVRLYNLHVVTATHVPAPALARDLGRADVLGLTLNVIGAGIFTMPAALAAGAGSASLAVLLFTIVLASIIALCLVEVASRFDITGGPMIYARDAFGPGAGFVVGWLMYLSRLAAFGAIVVVMLDYAAGLWPALATIAIRTAVITAIVVALAAMDLRGVAKSVRVSGVLGALKLIALLAIVGAGALLAPRVSAALPAVERVTDLGGPILIAFFACMGFEAGAVMAGEVRDPSRNLAVGILGAVGSVFLLYILLMIVCLWTVPDLAHSSRPLADAATAALGPMGATAVSLIAVLSCAGVLTMVMLNGTRILYALAEQGDLPLVIASVHHHRRTPVVAIVVSAVLIWLLTVSGTFVYLATFAAMARLLTYGSTCAALIILRRQGPAPMQIPFGPVLAVLAVVTSACAVAATTGPQIRDLSIAILVGLGLRTAAQRSIITQVVKERT